MAIGVGEIANFVDREQLRPGVMSQATAQCGIAVQGGKIAKQLAGAGEQDGVPLDQRPVGDVLREHRFADTVRADQHDVGGVAEELKRHQRFDGDTVAALGPTPVEVADRLETADPR